MSQNPPEPQPSSSDSTSAATGVSRPSKRSGQRGKNRLLALGSAAVLAVYSAGYLRTRAAAQQFDALDSATRRPSSPPTAPVVSTPLTAKAVGGVTKKSPTDAPSEKAPSTAATPVPVPAATVTAAPSLTAPAATASLPAASVPVAVTAVVATPAISSPVANASVPAVNEPPVVPASSGSPVPPTAAPVAVPAVAASNVSAKVAEAPRPKWKDGKFSGWGSCRHGDIQATIEIKGGRIISAVVSDCRTRYACDVIDRIVPQVVARQSADVDTVSGATQSADAFYYAVTAALASAKPEAVKTP